MKKINKALAAGITLAFLALVKPDPMPGLLGTGFISILLYEANYYCITYIRRMIITNRKARDLLQANHEREQMRKVERQQFIKYKSIG